MHEPGVGDDLVPEILTICGHCSEPAEVGKWTKFEEIFETPTPGVMICPKCKREFDVLKQ